MFYVLCFFAFSFYLPLVSSLTTDIAEIGANSEEDIARLRQ
jgi:hypothetical protein